MVVVVWWWLGLVAGGGAGRFGGFETRTFYGDDGIIIIHVRSDTLLTQHCQTIQRLIEFEPRMTPMLPKM